MAQMTATTTLERPTRVAAARRSAGPRANGTAAPGLAYRPSLDGLRAIAVGLVILFHAELSPASGGFIGVDVFFVLSGYLVTSMVLVQRAGGTLNLVDFYGRRVRRLLPAALVVIVGVGVLWLAIASAVDRSPVAADARWAALYLSNWHFADTAVDYFASNNSPSPFLHFWSLSVEEQFYLAWPAIMVLVWRLGRRPGAHHRGRGLRLGPLATVAGILAAASLVALVLAVAGGQDDLAYYGTHTRAYQLLFGALLAMLVQAGKLPGGLGRAAAVLQVAFLGGLAVLASSVLDMGAPARGVAAAVCTIGLLASLELAATGVVGRALSVGPLVYVGQISYATYLWHYPVIVTIRRFATIPAPHLAVVAGLLSLALAALSLRLLETPIRKSRALSRRARGVIVAGLLCSLAAGLVVPAALRTDRRPDVHQAQAGAGAAAAGAPRVDMTGFDLERGQALPPGSPAAGERPADQSCTRVPLADCVLVEGPGPRVLLMGDSHAGMLVPPLRALARAEGLSLAMASATGCPWQRDLVFESGDPERCQQLKRAWYEDVIPQYDPDIVVLATRATDHAIGGDYAVAGTAPGMEGLDQSQLLVRSSEQSLRQLAGDDRQLVVVEPVPVSPMHVLGCLSGARFADECNFAADVAPSPAEQAYRGFATSIAGVRTIDMDPWVCPRLPTCEAVVAGAVVRKDHDHLTARFAATLSAQLDLTLRDAGVL